MKKLKSLWQPTVKISWPSLAPFWYRMWQTDGRTDISTTAKTCYSTTPVQSLPHTTAHYSKIKNAHNPWKSSKRNPLIGLGVDAVLCITESKTTLRPTANLGSKFSDFWLRVF